MLKIPILASLALNLLASVRAQSAITACPANAKTFTTEDGSVYEHCPFADFGGKSLLKWKNSNCGISNSNINMVRQPSDTQCPFCP